MSGRGIANDTHPEVCILGRIREQAVERCHPASCVFRALPYVRCNEESSEPHMSVAILMGIDECRAERTFDTNNISFDVVKGRLKEFGLKDMSFVLFPEADVSPAAELRFAIV